MYTWKAPADQSLQQLYYILVKHRFRNSTKHVQRLSGADIASDHNLLVADICTRLKEIINLETNLDTESTSGIPETLWNVVMEISCIARVRNKETIQRDQQEKGILQTTKRKNANCTGHMSRSNCLLKHISQGRTELKGRRKIRNKQLLDHFQ
jgi:hypothetical protein